MYYACVIQNIQIGNILLWKNLYYTIRYYTDSLVSFEKLEDVIWERFCILTPFSKQVIVSTPIIISSNYP